MRYYYGVAIDSGEFIRIEDGVVYDYSRSAKDWVKSDISANLFLYDHPMMIPITEEDANAIIDSNFDEKVVNKAVNKA